MKIVSNKPTITRKELESVLDCLIHDELKSGESVKNFETTIAKMIGLKYSLSTSSLTSAYHLIFHALEFNDTSEVIMPSFFSQAPLSALRFTGGRPVLVDNDKDSLFPSAQSITNKINDKTKAIIIGHVTGVHFPMEDLQELNIPIIEDISHSIGTERNDIPSGKNGTFSIASFDPSGIITTGNGGIVLTNNSKYFSAMRDLRGDNDSVLNLDYVMTDFQGAMGISQLLRLQNFLQRRREIAKIYHESLRLTEHKVLFQFNESFAYQSFPIVFNAPVDKIEKYWRKNRIELLHPIRHPLHNFCGMPASDFPHCDRLTKKLYSLPIYPTLSRKDIEKISKTLAKFI